MNYINYRLQDTWKKDRTGKEPRPRLFVAPMEGVGDKPFRQAMAAVGGFDEICTEFLRVPANAHVASLAAKYDPNELGATPLAVQIMGQNPALMGEMAYQLAMRGAPRIEINCGCPSNTVTGKGAGSSLLRTPELLHEIARQMVLAAGDCPVSLKMRLGYEDTQRFFENLDAAERSGIQFLTIHGRTKEQRYQGYAHWGMIAEAKRRVAIPLVANGDIQTPLDALHIARITGCDGIMIGRGAVARPWIFHQILEMWNEREESDIEKSTEKSGDYRKLATLFLMEYDCALRQILDEGREEAYLAKWKQILNYMLGHTEHQEIRHRLLRGGSSSDIIKTLLNLFGYP
jgi:tRNA-dihydrouridine synthase C